MKKLIYALRFMTIIPIKWKEGEDMGEVARSISFFPFVGLIIGLINWGLYKLSILFFSPLFTSILVLVLWVVLTGGLHLDGLADTADGVWGGTSRERRLEIMKDSRTGAFGVLALICFLLLKTGALFEHFSSNDSAVLSVLVTAPLMGRWISVFSIYFFKTARKEGLGSFFKSNTGRKELIISLLLTLVGVYIFAGYNGLTAMAIVTSLSLAASLFFNGKLGGLTGDIYGALCESAELQTLVVLLLL